MSESKFYHLSPAGKLTRVGSVAEALKAVKDGGFIWLHYHRPKREEMSALMEPLGLHPLSIEDCFDEEQIPKIEDYPTNTFILFNDFSYADAKLSIDEVDLFVGEKYLVTVTGSGPSDREPLAGVHQIVEREIEKACRGPAFLMHLILDDIVDRKFTAIELLEEELDRMEEKMLAAVARFNPGDLIRLRRHLMALRKSVFHEREILTKICRRDSRFVSEEAIYHYRDIYDHLAKFFELVETCRDLVTSLMEMYLSLLNNEMTLAAQRTNSSVRRLTLIATIFMPLTFLAGIFGMSEWTMMTGAENWKIAYPVFLLVMVLLGLADYYLLRRLEKRRPRRHSS